MHILKTLIGKSQNSTNGTTPSHPRLKRAVFYACMVFFVTAVVFVIITYKGDAQAGIIEVSGAAFLFVIFLHILKIVTPQSSGRIITALSLIIALMLIYVNYSLQANKNREYTFRELLVGDLLLKKLYVKQEDISDEDLARKLKAVIPGKFAQMKTERDTIESPFEKPEKGVLGEPAVLPLEKLSRSSTRKEKMHSFYVPEEIIDYKFKIADREGLNIDRAKMVRVGFVASPDRSNAQILRQHIPAPFHIPAERNSVGTITFQTVYDKQEPPAMVSEAEMQAVSPEGHATEGPRVETPEKLQSK